MKFQNVYDNNEFFKSYIDMRGTEVNPNSLVEVPIIFSLMPDVKGKDILDLGCGYGKISKLFVENGAKSVMALDISQNMIDLANKQNGDKKIEYQVMAIENIGNIDKKFDIVYSSLAFHYVKDFDLLLKNIYSLLKPNGILVFSQESPINTAIIEKSKMENRIEIEGKRYYLISDYNNEGLRSFKWNEVEVFKYHRTYASIVNSLIENNFKILRMEDSIASEEAVKKLNKLKYQKDKPYFTFVKAQKEEKAE